MAEAGSVWVSVLPSLKGFVSKVNAELKGIGDVTVQVKTQFDGKQIKTEAAAAAKEAGATVKVDADTTLASAKLKAWQKEHARSLDIHANVDVDVGGATAKLLAFSVASKSSVLGLSALTVGAAGAVHVIGGLGPVISAAVGAAALLPAVAVAGGAAMGTLALGLHGVGDAVKNAFDPANAEKFNAALAKLAPNARSTVLAIQGLGPAFKAMQLGVQNALFANMGSTLSALGKTYLPIAQAGFTKMATEINDSTVAFGQFLLQKDTVASLRAATDNVTLGFHNLVFGGMDPALQSITTLAAVGSAQLPGIGSAIASVLSQFNQFIQSVAESGQLNAFFDAAVQTIGTLFQLVGNLGSIFISVFSAASQSGTSLLTVLNNGAAALAGFLSSAQGMDLIKSIFSAVAQTLQAAMPLLSAIGSTLVDTVLPAVVGVLPQIGAALGALAPAIAPLGQALAAMAPVIGVVAGVIANVLVAAVQALAPVLVQLAPVAAQLALALGTALLAAIQTLAPVLQPLVPVISGIVSALSFLAPIIGPLAVVIRIIAGAFALVSAAVSVFTVVVGIFEAVFSPIGIIILLVIGVIALLAAAVYLIITNWSTISSFFVNLWTTVSGAFVTAWNGILNFLTTVWGAIWSTVTTVWNGIINFFTTVFSGVWNTIVSVWNGILNFFSTVFNAIWSVVMTVWNGITNYFTSLFNAHRALIMQVWTAVFTFLGTIWGAILGVATTIWNAVSSVFSTVWNAIRSVAVTVWNAISSFFTTAFNVFKSTFSVIWNAISAVFMTVWNAIRNTAVTVWNAIVAFLTPAFNLFRTVFTTVWNAISTVFTTVWNAIRTVATTVWGAISSFFAGAFAVFKSTFSTIWNTIAGVFTTIWNGIKSTAQNIWNGIIAVVKGAVNGVIDAANWMVDKVNVVLNFLLIKPVIPRIPRMEAGGILTLAMGGIPALAKGGRLPDVTQGVTFAARGTRIGGGFQTSGPQVIVGEGRRCIAEGTLVTTDRGDIPIQDIRPGHRALTRHGFKLVSWGSRTRPDADVLTVEAESGRVVCTPDHRVWATARSGDSGNGSRVGVGSGPVRGRGVSPCHAYAVGQSYPGAVDWHDRSRHDGEVPGGSGVGAGPWSESAWSGPEADVRRGRGGSRGREASVGALLALVRGEACGQGAGAFGGVRGAGRRSGASVGVLPGWALALGERGLREPEGVRDLSPVQAGQGPRVDATEAGRRSRVLRAGEKEARGGCPQVASIEEGHWIEARELTPGDLVWTADTQGDLHPSPVVSVTVAENIDTYDITVEGEHEFVAGGMLVHNSHPEYVIPTDPMYRSRAMDLHASLTADLYGSRPSATQLSQTGQVDATGTPMLASGGILGAVGEAAKWVGGGIGAIAAEIKNGINSLIPAGIFKGAGGWLVDKVVAAVEAMIAKATAAVGGGVAGGGTGPVADQVRAVAARYGWGGGPEWDALSWVIGHESGWNPNAKNPTSTAYGLFQFLDSTWASVGGRKTSNAGEQAEYGMRYIKSRYRDPIGAKGFWSAHHWYDQGGIAGGSGIMMKKVIAPERVLSPRQTVAFEQLVPLLAGMQTATAPSVTGDYSPAGAGTQITNNYYTESSVSQADATVRAQRRQAALGLFAGGAPA